MTNNKLTDEHSAKFDFQALREMAKKATPGKWEAFIHTASRTCSVHTPGDKRCDNVVKWSGFDGQKNAEANAKFIAAANPAAVLVLLSRLDELRIEVESANARVDIKCAELCGMDEKLAAKDAELQEYRNAAQKAPGDFLSRMHDELNQLRMRAKGLHAFIGTPSFKALREEAGAAMIRQLDVMSEYIEILHHRIRMAESE